MFYLRSLSCMVTHHTGVGVVKCTDILHNRESRERVFISDNDIITIIIAADSFQRLMIYLGVYMSLRRVEMQSINDCDIDRGTLTVHGKSHEQEGLAAYMLVPMPVLDAIEEYRVSTTAPTTTSSRTGSTTGGCTG